MPFGISEPDRSDQSDRCRAFIGNPVVFCWWFANSSQSSSGASLALESFGRSWFLSNFCVSDLFWLVPICSTAWDYHLGLLDKFWTSFDSLISDQSDQCR